MHLNRKIIYHIKGNVHCHVWLPKGTKIIYIYITQLRKSLGSIWAKGSMLLSASLGVQSEYSSLPCSQDRSAPGLRKFRCQEGIGLNGPLFAATSASASWNTHLLRMDTSRIHPGLVGPQVSATIRGVTNRVMNSWLQIYDLQTLSWLFAQTSWGHMINEDFWSHPHFRTDQNPSLLVAWNSSPLVAIKKKTPGLPCWSNRVWWRQNHPRP